MKKLVILALAIFTFANLVAQDAGTPLPYREIPAYPETFTPETVAARMIDGLGFRYFWATEGLRTEDLAFKPNDDARSTDQTIDHILDLTVVIVNAVKQVPNVRNDAEKLPLTFDEKRKTTLENLQTAADLLRSGAVKLEDCKLVFQNSESTTVYPFWNNLNGPIADALWHCGQVASFRRSSGNPFNPKVSVFQGKLRE